MLIGFMKKKAHAFPRWLCPNIEKMNDKKNNVAFVLLEFFCPYLKCT
jgi:hypothetical protein